MTPTKFNLNKPILKQSATLGTTILLSLALGACSKPTGDTSASDGSAHAGAGAETGVHTHEHHAGEHEHDSHAQPVAAAFDPANDKSDTVVLYSARKEQLIQPLLDKFTEQTGIKTQLITDKAAPLMARLEAEGENSPADIFLTVDAGNLWQAANKGLFQPVTSEVLASNVPAKLKDPSNLWYGLSIRARTIFYNPKTLKPEDIKSYENLASPDFKGKLCLRTSKKVYNQSLVAMMIAHHGTEKTEQIVKGWVDNLAADVFSNDTKLLNAIEAGQCQVGIANSYYYGRIVADNPDFKVNIYWPNQAVADKDMIQGVHVNVSGAGITKHAPSPAKAQKLIEWLSQPEAQGVYSAQDKEYPVNASVKPSELLASWGSFKQDVINVSDAGRLQAEAVKLMDRAGYR